MFLASNILAVFVYFIIPIILTIYVARAKNPYSKGTDEHQALRVCRIGLALMVWSFGFGLFGFVLALVAFILGIIGIVKGRTVYGLVVISGSFCFPIIGFFFNLGTFRSV